MAEKKIHKPFKVEPGLVVFVFVILATLLGRLFMIFPPAPQFVRWFGLGLSGFGLALGLLALREFRRIQAFPNPKDSSIKIVTTGIYSRTRNPINLGFLLILIGLPLANGNYWGILLIPTFIVAMNDLVIKPEETYLEKKFKEQFINYKSRVRRWL
jgi:protein-S-isoprenylcysteine O-methyltransferase Ste14